MKTVTWTFTREYTDEEFEALDISEISDLYKRGYYEVIADWTRVDSMDDMSIGVSILSDNGVSSSYAAHTVKSITDSPEVVALVRKCMYPTHHPIQETCHETE